MIETTTYDASHMFYVHRILNTMLFDR